MRRYAVLAAALVLVSTSAAYVQPAAASTTDCSGYPEPRTFLEVQSWWTEPDIAEPMHLHAGTCFPLGQNMKGTSTFDVRVMLHNNPGILFALSFDFYSGHTKYINVPDVTCGLGSTCTYWYSVTINWADVDAGWRELRLKPRMRFPASFDTDPGATQITSSGWPVQVRGGTSGTRKSCQTNPATCFTESRGWYEHRGYQNVEVRDVRLLIGSGNTWSGTVSIPLKLNCGCGGDDTPTTFSAAYIDPMFHDPGHPGNTPIKTWAGKFVGNLSLNTAGLSNGPHRLVLLAAGDEPDHAVPGVVTGVGVYTFEVDN